MSIVPCNEAFYMQAVAFGGAGILSPHIIVLFRHAFSTLRGVKLPTGRMNIYTGGKNENETFQKCHQLFRPENSLSLSTQMLTTC